MKKRIVGIVVFLVAITLGSAWYLGVFRQLGLQGKSFSSVDHVAREEARREAAQKRVEEEEKSRVYQPPQWPASSTIDWGLRNQLPKELVEKIDQSPVPVLVPSEKKYLEGATMVDTTFVFNREGGRPIGLTISAYQTETSTIPTEWQREVRGMPASGLAGTLSSYRPGDIPDGSWRLQWRENNINYLITLTCFPNSCLGEPDLFHIAESLRYVGGKHAEGGVE